MDGQTIAEVVAENNVRCAMSKEFHEGVVPVLETAWMDESSGRPDMDVMLNKFTEIRDAVVGEEALLKTADLAELGGAEIKDVLANQININSLQIDKEIGSVSFWAPRFSLRRNGMTTTDLSIQNCACPLTRSSRPIPTTPQQRAHVAMST